MDEILSEKLEELVGTPQSVIKSSLQDIDRATKRLIEINKEYLRQIQEYRNGKESHVERINETYSLANLSKKEYDAEKTFRDKHYKSCSNGNHYVYDLFGTGFGLIVKIKCPVCGAEEDITDIDSW